MPQGKGPVMEMPQGKGPVMTEAMPGKSPTVEAMPGKGPMTPPMVVKVVGCERQRADTAWRTSQGPGESDPE